MFAKPHPMLGIIIAVVLWAVMLWLWVAYHQWWWVLILLVLHVFYIWPRLNKGKPGTTSGTSPS